MKLEELPISVQEQISETHENSDEILTKIKKKIRENEFILEIANEETLYYDSKNIYEVFYDDDDEPFIIKNNKEIIIDDVIFYHFLPLNLIKIYLLKENDDFYFCKEYYITDKSAKDLTLKKEYFYEKLTRENIKKYINPWLLSNADFSLLKKHLDIDSEDKSIDNKIIFYLYENTQKNPLFCQKIKEYNLLKHINFCFDVRLANEIINKIDNNPNLERLLIVDYDSVKDLYDKINYMEELINKNIVSLKV